MLDDIMLVVGPTGSVDRHVVAEALRLGYRTRALVRKPTGCRTA
jgi:uncharacterized protein YbjT (DUF2867 family)